MCEAEAFLPKGTVAATIVSLRRWADRNRTLLIWTLLHTHSYILAFQRGAGIRLLQELGNTRKDVDRFREVDCVVLSTPIPVRVQVAELDADRLLRQQAGCIQGADRNGSRLYVDGTRYCGIKGRPCHHVCDHASGRGSHWRAASAATT